MADTTERKLADFAGQWDLGREIVHSDGTQARFDGTAVWRWRDGGLDYTETGLLAVAGQAPLRAERHYVWAPDLTVWFEDGRLFHQVPAQGGATGHWCDPDQYDGHYDFAQWPRFTVTWQVRGPRKAYSMTSLYSPRG